MSEVYRMISNNRSYISSMEIIAQLEFLRSERAEVLEKVEATLGWVEESGMPKPASLVYWDNHYGKELETLEKLNHQCSRFTHWATGAALIRDSHFVEYAKELAYDLGDLRRDVKWTNECIDWEKAVTMLQEDYSQVDFDGVTYWIKS